jgi:hypothetical protein
MSTGINRAAVFVLFLAKGTFDDPICLFEIREALAMKKKILLIHEMNSRFLPFIFDVETAKADADLKEMLANNESVPFRRRGYERDGMVQSLIEKAGFKEMVVELAKMPHAVSKFDLKSFQDRRQQRELVELLILPHGHLRFSTCVLIHGIGGTGKTVMAVAAIQDAAVRQHFSSIYWLAVGQDATGVKLRELQSLLFKQLTVGMAVKSEEIQGKDEVELHDVLVNAMVLRRALVVLDDPWHPEQVQYLNPIRGSRSEHRLLVTTRIRSLVPDASCVELALMGSDEAVALLLRLADITEKSYLDQQPMATWPPQEAYDIVNECGRLPLTLSITSQVVRKWGSGWERSVLPLLKERRAQQHSKERKASYLDDGLTTPALSTVEGRIIAAGLQALKEKGADTIEELLAVFVVTREDVVHSMPVIELLWRSTSAGENVGEDLMMRLKLRQWTQLLVNHSLLMGSMANGVQLHSHVLAYLRNQHSASELQALQKRVVEEMIRMSGKNAFEETGDTSEAFNREEVDWYVCNVGSHHVKGAIGPLDPLVPVSENEDVTRWLLQLDDRVLFRQTALAVGSERLHELAAHCAGRSQWLEAAKAKWGAHLAAKTPSLATLEELLALIRKYEPDETNADHTVLQLELDATCSIGLFGHCAASELDTTRVGGRIVELSKNSSLQADHWGVVMCSIYPQIELLLGCTIRAWEGGREVVDDAIFDGMSLWYKQATPLMLKAAADEDGKQVTAKHEHLKLLQLLFTPGAYFHPIVHTTDQSVALFQTATNKHWGKDCAALMAAIAVYQFGRHFQIARTIGSRGDTVLHTPIEWHVAERTGNLQQCIEINERKYLAMGAYIQASPVPGSDLSSFLASRGAFFGAEELGRMRQGHSLVPLQPRQKLARLLAYAGIAETSQVEAAYHSSAEWGYCRAMARSSSDGLHHEYHAHAYVALMRALSTMVSSARDLDTSWLDGLPPSNASTLHCVSSFCKLAVNGRVLVAEVFEQQGRYEEAIQFAQADLQELHNFNLASKIRAGRMLGRCHAELGQHMLSVSVFDAAIELANTGNLLLSEALSIRGRALAGEGGGGGGGRGGELHWDEDTGSERLQEVIGRMQGPKEVLEKAMARPPLASVGW